jgi:hypothetical protein
MDYNFIDADEKFGIEWFDDDGELIGTDWYDTEEERNEAVDHWYANEEDTTPEQ